MHHTVNVHALNDAHARDLVAKVYPGHIVSLTEYPRITTFKGGRLHFCYSAVVYVVA